MRLTCDCKGIPTCILAGLQRHPKLCRLQGKAQHQLQLLPALPLEQLVPPHLLQVLLELQALLQLPVLPVSPLPICANL